MRLSLVPRPTEFYDLFARAGENALEAARHAETRFREYPNSSVTQADVKAIETAGDQITRDLITLLNTQYVTPFDREDIYELATSSTTSSTTSRRSATCSGCTGSSHDEARRRAVPDPRPGGRAALDRAHPAEGPARDPAAARRAEAARGRGRPVVHDAIAALFRDDRIDPLIVIRWKDVYEGLERAIDSCETAANVVANIAVKNA